ncbi:EpsG family protein [Aeromonas popoffii]|uniref:EpsG family protein n=1 Tax=Aeromonas popoffii TaxID=70856 RepID=UPI0005A93525|nr:EpsG family protein [Aeromonas popoffii]
MRFYDIKLVDKYIFILLFLTAWCLYGGNRWNGDRDAYELYYVRDSIVPWGVEILYGYMNILSHKLDLSFQSFQIIISFITIVLVCIYFNKMYQYPGIAILLYLLLMFPLDYVLMRTSLSYAIVLNAFVFLFRDKRGVYFSLVVIAALIHQSAALFLIFLLVKRGGAINKAPVYIMATLFFAIFIQGVFYYGYIPQKIIAHLSYYEITWKTTVSCIFFHALSVFLINLDFKGRRGGRYDVFILNANIVSLLIMVLYFQSDIFVRVFRLLVFINIVYLFQRILVTKKTTIYALIYIVFYSFYLFIYYVYPVIDYTLVPLFQSFYFF